MKKNIEQISYSEEDMIAFSKFCQEDEYECRFVNLGLLKEWFEQFKNKQNDKNRNS
jgi:hypothetical protein